MIAKGGGGDNEWAALEADRPARRKWTDVRVNEAAAFDIPAMLPRRTNWLDQVRIIANVYRGGSGSGFGVWSMLKRSAGA